MITNKGIDQDSDYNTMDNGAALTAYNCILTSNKRARTNEPGFLPIPHTIDTLNPTNLLGTIELPDGFICFYVSTYSGYSYIIRFVELEESLGTYTMQRVAFRKTDLNFSLERPIKGEFTYNYNKELIIVFIEGCSDLANPPRYINCDKAYKDGFLINSIKLTLDVGCVNFTTNTLSNGVLPVGVYQLKIKYLDSEDLETNSTNSSNLIPIVKSGNSVNNLQGGSSTAISNKSLKVIVANLSQDYTKCKLCVTHYNGIANAYYESDIIYYTGIGFTYVITSLDDLVNSSYESIFVNTIAIEKANAIAKMNNSLLLGNIEVINLGTIINVEHPDLTTISNGTGIEGTATLAALGQAIANNTAVNYLITPFQGDTVDGSGNVFSNEDIVTGTFSDPEFCSTTKSLMPDEVYALYLTLKLKTGGSLGTWHIPGRNSTSMDLSTSDRLVECTPAMYGSGLWTGNFKGYYKNDTSLLGVNPSYPIKTLGYMGCWVNNDEVYPSNFPSTHLETGDWTTGPSNHILPLAGENVRHHRAPRAENWNTHVIISLSISNIIIPESLQNYVEGFEIHYAKRNKGNSLVVIQGLYNSISQYSRRFHSFDALYYKMDLSTIKRIKRNRSYKGLTTTDGTHQSILGANEYYAGADFSDNDYPGWSGGTGNWEVNKDSFYINDLSRPSDSVPSADFSTDPMYMAFAPNPKNLKFRECNDEANNKYQESHYTLYASDLITGVGSPTNNVWNDGSCRLVTLYNEYDNLYYPFGNQDLALAGGSNSNPTSGNSSFVISMFDVVLATYFYRINYAHNLFTRDDGDMNVEITLPPNTISGNGDGLGGSHTGDKAYFNPEVGRGGNIEYLTYMIKTTHYSIANANFRHEGVNQGETFYPVCSKETWHKTGALVDNWINTATGKGYNTAFSKTNDIDPNLIVNLNTKHSTKLPYRICVSNPNRTESLQFNWRKFDMEYFDVNYDKGEIVVLFATPSKLYIQQEHALFISTLTDTLKSDEGGIGVHAGTLLERTPVEVMDDNIGAIGCITRFSNKLTKIGYIAIDIKKRKIFIVRDTVTTISDIGLKKFFEEHLIANLDNPYINSGIYIIDDIIDNDRIIICDNTSSGFTLSYDIKILQPISFHNYSPVMVVRSRESSTVFANNDIHGMYRMNKGEFGNYIRIPFVNTSSPMWFDFQLNPQFNIEKLLRSLTWITLVTNHDSVIDYTKTFDRIVVYTDTQCTGYLDVKSQDCWYNHIDGKMANGNWLFNNLKDLVINDTQPLGTNLFDLTLNQSNMLESPEFFVNSALIANYFIIRFVFFNTDGSKLVFNDFNANLYKVTR